MPIRKNAVAVFTPLQINKGGLERACDAADEGEYDWGMFDQLAIDTFTDAYRDCDAIISVFQRGYLKDQNQVKVGCMKSRGLYPEPIIVDIDPRTWYFRQSEDNVVRALNFGKQAKNGGGKTVTYSPDPFKQFEASFGKGGTQ
jgi:hypothetical protein